VTTHGTNNGRGEDAVVSDQPSSLKRRLKRLELSQTMESPHDISFIPNNAHDCVTALGRNEMGVSGAGSRSDPQAPDVTTQAEGKKGPEDNALRAHFRQAGLETGMDPDVILVDQLMGSVDAAAVIPWLTRSHPDCPILVISHSPMTTEQVQASGAHGFVPKPRSAQDVRALVAACLALTVAVTTQAGGKKGPEDNALRALFRQAGLETGGPGPALSPRNPPAWAVTEVLCEGWGRLDPARRDVGIGRWRFRRPPATVGSRSAAAGVRPRRPRCGAGAPSPERRPDAGPADGYGHGHARPPGPR